MGATDVSELKEDVASLKDRLESVDRDVKTLNATIKDIAEQYHTLKHNHANMAQGVVNTQQALNRLEPLVEKLVEKITGDEKFGNLGIIQILKHQEKFNEDIHKRVSNIEEVGRTEEKLLTYKKGLLYTIFGTIGMGVLTLLKTFGAWFLEHFKF